MSEINQEKEAARLLVRERLASVRASEIRAWSSAISERLLEWSVTRDAQCPMVYLATPDEAWVDGYADQRIRDGLEVCGPRVDWQTWEMTPRLLESFGSGIEIRKHGIREPISSAAAVDPVRIDVVLIPGVVFDESGARVGRGAGCYDRFFARNDLMEGILAVGVCFEAQLVASAPSEGHDVRLDAIVTEQRIIEPMKQ